LFIESLMLNQEKSEVKVKVKGKAIPVTGREGP
jgi:hypothetical protein